MKHVRRVISFIVLLSGIYFILTPQASVSAQYASTCTTSGGTCMDVCTGPGYVPASGTCAFGVCCRPYVPPDNTCSGNGGTCRSFCDQGWVSMNEICSSGTCCRPAGCASGTCESGCVWPEVNTGSCGGGVCCEQTNSCPTVCTASCGVGQIDTGQCNFGKCCSTSVRHDCVINTGCGLGGCGSTDTWMEYYDCPVETPCNQAAGGTCVLTGGACAASTSCTGCHPTQCTIVGGLGGCPGGQGSVDNCGGVDCGTEGCTGGVPNPTATPVPGTNTPTSTPIPAPGTIRARLVQVASDATTCASTTYISGSIGTSPYADPGYQTASSGNYVAWTVTPGTYSVAPITPTGYSLKIACYTSGYGMTATVGANQTVTWDLGYTLGAPWFQAKEGDVYAASGTMYSPVPPGASPMYAFLDGAGGTPGIVTYAADYDFDGSILLKGDGYISSKGWLASESYANTDFYAVMYHRFGSPTAAAYAADSTIASEPASSTTPYYVPGNVTIEGTAWNLTSGQSVVLIVNGNLTIKNRINIASGGFAAFIVNGEIHIDSTVGTTYASETPVIEGIYITSPTGGIYTGTSTSPAARRFVGRGTFVGGGIYPQRNLDADVQNNVYSADLFLYNPELLVTMPDEMLDAPISWEEVAP